MTLPRTTAGITRSGAGEGGVAWPILGQTCRPLRHSEASLAFLALLPCPGRQAGTGPGRADAARGAGRPDPPAHGRPARPPRPERCPGARWAGWRPAAAHEVEFLPPPA